jgi:predicted dehydrogenase
MNKEGIVKVAFVGAGYMTSEHLKAFGSIPNVDLAGIYSKTRGRAEKLAEEYEVKNVVDSISALHDSTNADLVMVSVPELATFEVCKEVFKHPWTILIEKPVGFNLEDAGRIYELAKSSRSKVFVALNRRHYGSTRSVIDELKSVEGLPRIVELFDQEDQISALRAGQPEMVVKNWMFANSIHIIDYLNIFCRGNLLGVENIISWDPINPFLVFAKANYDSGDVGIYRCVWNAPGPWSVSITTKSKRWEMRPLEVAHSQDYGSRKSMKLSEFEMDTIFKPGLKFQAEQAIRAALGKANTLCTLDESMHLMELISKIYKLGEDD